MRKSKVLFLICVLLCSMVLNAQMDSLYKVQHKQIQRLGQSLDSVKSANAELILDVKIKAEKIDEIGKTLDSLQSIVVLNTQNIKVTAEQLGIKIDEANTSLYAKADANDLQIKTFWGIGLLILLVIISAIVYYWLHKRIVKGDKDVSVLKLKADKLNEDILNQFSLEMVEMQKISTSLSTLSVAQTSQINNVTPDHSLIKTLADRITFMEMTLYKMDSSVKGHKTLAKAIVNMKNNLFANGYEVVDMLGKSYHEGMMVTNTDFIDDELLKSGERLITKVVKPQINYKGKMIQSAQIQVSQNI